MITESEPYSREAHIRRFNEYLAAAVEEGEHAGGCCTWMDEETTAAIARVARAHPNPDPALIEAARAEFSLQLDGTHAAEVQAYFDQAYATWPQSPFAHSVRTAFEHVLRFIDRPAEYEEADAARTKLDGALTETSGNPRRRVIVEQLRMMIDELDVIPDYEIPIDSGPGQTDAFAGSVERALKQFVNFAEAEPEANLSWARIELGSAARRRPPSTRWRRDFGIIIERLGRILAAFEPGRADG